MTFKEAKQDLMTILKQRWLGIGRGSGRTAITELEVKISQALDICECMEDSIINKTWVEIRDKDTLPKRSEHDWVLVACCFLPEGWYGVPNVGELRNGVWYDRSEKPIEETYGVKVTHWCPMPKNPTKLPMNFINITTSDDINAGRGPFYTIGPWGFMNEK